MSRAFDETELLGSVDNDWEFLGETVRMLAADGPALLEAIRLSVGAGDAAAVGRQAHALKGMISNFSSPQTHAGALAIEQMGKAGELSLAGPALRSLENRLNALIADLTDFLATRA